MVKIKDLLFDDLKLLFSLVDLADQALWAGGLALFDSV